MEGGGSRQRINASLMSDYQGKQVCLMGKATNVDNNGMYFTLTTSDNQEIHVDMNMPLNEYVSGLTEVHGRVKGKTIACENYVVFSEEASNSFDMGLYNQAVELMQRCTDQYVQGVTEQ